MTKCKGKRWDVWDYVRCNANALKGSEYCRHHQPTEETIAKVA